MNKDTSCNIRVATYNVLSSALASPSHFTSCNAADLAFSQRLPRVLTKLDEEVHQQAIICLQEVSHDFVGPLHVFFAKRNYHFITGLYGKRFNNYMGIGLAFPLEKFEAHMIDISTLSDKREGGWPREPRKPEPAIIVKVVNGVVVKPVTWLSGQLSKVIVSVANIVLGEKDESYIVKLLKGSSSKERDHWDQAQWRNNQLLFAKLRDKETNRVFGISTYHMPCAFYAPKVMNIHADMAMRRTQKLAIDSSAAKETEQTPIPTVLAGDFNLKPNSPEYQLITTGNLHEDDPTYPTSKFGMEWKISASPMKSAYVEANGCEPDFTNHAKCRDDDPFIDVLDYIFLSNEWEVKGVKKLPYRDDVNGPLPNENEPSDHILIAANLCLKVLQTSNVNVIKNEEIAPCASLKSAPSSNLSVSVIDTIHKSTPSKTMDTLSETITQTISKRKAVDDENLQNNSGKLPKIV